MVFKLGMITNLRTNSNNAYVFYNDKQPHTVSVGQTVYRKYLIGGFLKKKYW